MKNLPGTSTRKKTDRFPSTIALSSPFKDATAAFNLLNRDFPPYHNHMHWELLVMIQGSLIHTVNNMDFIYESGDACLIRPNDKHCLNYIDNVKSPCQYVNFTFRNDFAESFFSIHDSYNNLLNSDEILHFALDDADIVTITDRCLFTHNLPQENYEANTKLIICQILLKFFERRLLANPDYPLWFNNFLTYISTPSNFGKSAEELALSTPYSYTWLTRYFKKYTGITLIDYINDKKMIYAKRLLQTTTLTTLQISEKIGYSSLSSFNHLFKKTYNTTPSEYRKQHSRENN